MKISYRKLKLSAANTFIEKPSNQHVSAPDACAAPQIHPVFTALSASRTRTRRMYLEGAEKWTSWRGRTGCFV